MVLAGKGLYSRRYVDALVGSELLKFFRLHADVGPVQVPIGFFRIVEFEIHSATHFLYHCIAGVLCTQNQFLLSRFLRHKFFVQALALNNWLFFVIGDSVRFVYNFLVIFSILLSVVSAFY